MTAETLTILRCAGSFSAQKVITPIETIGFNAGFEFTVSAKLIGSLSDFKGVLSDLENDPAAYIIRGEPLANFPGPVHRRKNGDDATFRERATHLFCVDVDNVAAPEGLAPCSDAAIEFVIRQLPVEFHQASVVAQFSNSAGTPKAGSNIKVHLWFWGVRPYASEELRAWARSSLVPDPALYNAVQPHYTARPRFVDMRDPFDSVSRVRYLRKTIDAVDVRLPSSDNHSPGPRSITEAEKSEIIFNQENKAIDGREKLLLNIRWQVLQQGHCQTECQFFEKVWANFTAKAELGPTSKSASTYDAARVQQQCHRDWKMHGFTVPPPQRPSLTPAEAGDVLESEIWLALNRTGSTVIRATAGLGKTTATVSALFELPDLAAMNVDIYAASRKEQRQWQTLLTAEAKRTGRQIQILLIEGRTEENCVQHKAAALLSGADISASQHLCKSREKMCSAFDGCPYLGQFAYHGSAIRVYTHAHLPTPPHEGLGEAHLVIIDESFYTSLAAASPAFAFTALGAMSAVRQRALIFNNKPGRDLDTWSALKHLLEILSEAIASGKPLLAKLRDQGVDAPALANASQLVLQMREHPRIEPHATTQQVTAEIKRAKISECRRLAAILSALATELEMPRDDSHSIRRLPDGKIEVCRRKSLARRCDGATVLILDADCEEAIVRAHFPEINFVKIDAPLNATIWQVDDATLSRHQLRVGQDKVPDAALVERVAAMITPFGNPLVVTYRDFIPALEKHLPIAHYAYFGNVRGTNEWKNLDTVFVVGRQYIPDDAVERIGRSLFWDSADPLVFGKPIRRRYAVGGGVLKSYDEVDPRLQAVRVASRDAETRQALARLRLVHSEHPKTVFLLSSQPVGVPVDHLIQLWPSKGTQEFHKLGRLLPYGAKELAHLAPEAFADEVAAQRWRDRAENTPEALKDILERSGVVSQRTWYRRKGSRGLKSAVLVDPLSHLRPEVSVSRILTGDCPDKIEVDPWDWEEIELFPEYPWLATFRLKSPKRGN